MRLLLIHKYSSVGPSQPESRPPDGIDMVLLMEGLQRGLNFWGSILKKNGKRERLL
jgi:hypothetical protein